MFDRLNNDAARVISCAQDEARDLGHPSVGPEHILLALTREMDNKAMHMLGFHGVTRYETRHLILAWSHYPGDERGPLRSPAGELPFTPLALAAIEQAGHAATLFGQKEIWSEHLLLALTRQGEGLADKLLTHFGAITKVRATLLRGLPHFMSDLPKSSASGAADRNPDTEGFDDQLRHIIVDARSEAEKMRHHRVGSEHLLLALTRGLNQAQEAMIFKDCRFNQKEAQMMIEAFEAASTGVFIGTRPFTPQADAVLEAARALAKKFNHRQVHAEHLLLAIKTATNHSMVTSMLCSALNIRLRLIKALTMLKEDPAPDVPDRDFNDWVQSLLEDSGS